MNTIQKFKTISIFAFLVVLSFSCKKGKDGEPGKDGIANVKASTYSVTSWANNGSRWYKQLTVTDLTTENINTAAVQVYWGAGNNTWTALPYTYVASSNYFMGYATSVNLVEVRWTYNGFGLGDDPNDELNTTVQIKVVVIPPAIKKDNPDIDWNNYAKVKEKFNLKD